MTLNPAIATVAAGAVVDPDWGTDVADTVNAAPVLIYDNTFTPTFGASGVSVGIPVNVYSRLRLTARGSFASPTDVTLKINGLYATTNWEGMSIVELGDGTRTVTAVTAGSGIVVARWGAVPGVLVLDVVNTKGTSVPSIIGESFRPGTTTATINKVRSAGRYNTAIALASIDLLGSAIDFTAMRVWVEGYR